MEYLPIIIIIGILVAFKVYGDVRLEEGWNKGYNSGKYDWQYIGSMNMIQFLDELKIVNAEQIARDFESGKYNDNPKVINAMAKIQKIKNTK